MEARTTAGGVALTGIIACLSTEPFKSADECYQAAIGVMVVAAAVFLALCRMVARTH